MSTQWDETEARETPVTDGCIWCKQPPDDPIPIGDAEVICQQCRGDLREYGRYRQAELYVTAGLEPSLRRIVLDHWDEIRAELIRQHADDPAHLFPLPTRKSNANVYQRQADSRARTDRD